MGFTESAAVGHRVGTGVAMGYVQHPNVFTPRWLAAQKGRFEVQVGGVRMPAEASFRGGYDPKSLRT